jgi:hypothetical protein
LNDLSSPFATYPLGSLCYSGIITDNRLYLCADEKLHIFEVTTSINKPLIVFTIIDTASYVAKTLKVGQELLLGEGKGYF